jgi:hypothetical protein
VVKWSASLYCNILTNTKTATDNEKGNALRKNIPDRQALILLLDDLLKKYPPAPLSLEISLRLLEISDNTINAYKILNDEYPELLLSDLFIRIYLPHKTASQIADEILSPETRGKKRKQAPHHIRFE